MKRTLAVIFGSLIMVVGPASAVMATETVAADDTTPDVGTMAFSTVTLANGCKIQGGNGHGTVSIGTHYPWAKTEMKNSTCDHIRAYIHYKRKSDGSWIGQYAPLTTWTSQNEIRVTAQYAASTYDYSRHYGRVTLNTGDTWSNSFRLNK